jgi:dimethylhistidine N-methyltransferase
MGHRVRFHDLHPEPADIRAEVLAGLALPQKRTPPKLFYDRRGSELFDAITRLPEYYPTRTEIGILQRHGEDMAKLVGRDAALIELGSGNSVKIQVLLQALAPRVYVPVDISRDHLLASAERLAARFEGIRVQAVCADYSAPFELPERLDGAGRAVFFPGSSIGNFEPSDAESFLARIGEMLGPCGRLLIGVDLPKDEAVLHAAYNDAQGVTAEFNLNLLRRINRELAGTFDLDTFRHRAFFNRSESRIEMHLLSTRDQEVAVAGERFRFGEGESIHTESSYKYDIVDFHALAWRAGFEPERVWTDAHRLFSVHCLRHRGH